MIFILKVIFAVDLITSVTFHRNEIHFAAIFLTTSCLLIREGAVDSNGNVLQVHDLKRKLWSLWLIPGRFTVQEHLTSTLLPSLILKKTEMVNKKIFLGLLKKQQIFLVSHQINKFRKISTFYTTAAPSARGWPVWRVSASPRAGIRAPACLSDQTPSPARRYREYQQTSSLFRYVTSLSLGELLTCHSEHIQCVFHNNDNTNMFYLSQSCHKATKLDSKYL